VRQHFFGKTGSLFARKLICRLINLPDAKRLTQNCVLEFQIASHSQPWTKRGGGWWGEQPVPLCGDPRKPPLEMVAADVNRL
jgi:hypothetical protein